MWKNYLKTTWRHMHRHRIYALLNVGGLAVGLAACLLIGRYVADEWRHDRFHAHADRIVRISSHINPADGDDVHIAAAPAPLKPALEAEVPEVESVVRLIGESYLLRRGSTTMQNDDLLYADPSFFDVFSFDLLQGNPVTALQAPNTIVLTESLAARYFGADEPVGKTLTADGERTLTVTGIVADPPPTSHLQFDALVSMATRRNVRARSFDNWAEVTFSTYVLLTPGTGPETFGGQLAEIVQRHAADRFKEYDAALDFRVMPLLDVYLHGKGIAAIGERGNPAILRVLLVVALFILLIAGINFVNLATARSVARAREVSVRKAVGARRLDLATQFFGEAVLTTLMALLVAVSLAYAALPLFRTVAGTTLAGGLIPNGWVAVALPVAVILVGLLAGTYPALVLAGFEPARVLRGNLGTSRDGHLLRRSLVVSQFAIAIALLASTGVVQQQLHYVNNRDLGFAAEQLVALDYNHDIQVNRRINTVRRELEQIPGVAAVSTSANVPGRGLDVTPLAVDRPGGGVQRTSALELSVGFDFFATYGIDLVAGRTFSRNFGSDSAKAVVVNRAASKHFGYPDPADALGKTLSLDAGEDAPRYVIVGIVENFHYGSLRERIAPLIMLPHGAQNADRPRFLTLRVQTDHLSETMEKVRERWTSLAPHRPFAAYFIDDSFAQLYGAERRFGHLFNVFAVLAIFVACLGLFGIATHAVQQRTKEISIRKTLGASVSSIVALLSRDFLLLVGAGFALAVPAAWWAMSRWLEGFAYHVSLGPVIFIGAGGTALLIAAVTVSSQALHAALTNPIDNLRHE